MRLADHDLLAAVLADPADDDLRRVYADRLCELGDPRGELIHLQYARLAGGSVEAAQRELELLERHSHEWIGPLVTVLAQRYEIERGFLHACEVPDHRRDYNVARIAGHPVWSTVERFTGPARIYLDPVMRSLRTLTPPPGIEELCAGAVARPLRTLRLRWISLASADAVAAAACTALPELAELWIGHAALDVLHYFATAAVGERLQRLAIHVGYGLHESLAPMFARLAGEARVPLVVVDASRWYTRESYELRRGAAGYDDLCVRLDTKVESHMLARIATQLAELIGVVRRCEICVRGERAIDLGPVAAVVSRFPEHAITRE